MSVALLPLLSNTAIVAVISQQFLRFQYYSVIAVVKH
jgi:hypothetical protein